MAAADPRPIRIIDYLRSPADDAASAWRSAAAGDIPRPPLLCALSQDGTTLIAVDGITGDLLSRPAMFRGDNFKIHRIPLPDRLRDCKLIFSSGHFLILQGRSSNPGLHIFSPFSSPAQFASLPPPPADQTFPARITFDADGRLALAILCGLSFRSIAYVSLDSKSPPSAWIDVADETLLHSQSRGAISFEYPFIYTGGLFYGVDDTGTRVYALDFSKAPQVKFTDKTFDLPDNCSAYDEKECCQQSASLVLSGSSIFLVRWRKFYSSLNERREMDVFLLDAGRREWGRVTSLGERSFFIGRNLSISMSTVDFPELKPGRVYLSFDADTHISGGTYHRKNYHGFGLHLFYDLADGTWVDFHEAMYLFQADTDSLDIFSVWMLPPAMQRDAIVEL